MKSQSLGLIVCAVVAVLGAMVWAAVAFGVGYEIGWLALGIGGAVGFAMARYAPDASRMVRCVVAALLAVGSIVAGKYAAVRLEVDDEVEQFRLSYESRNPYSFEAARSYYFREKVTEAVQSGRPLNWPRGRSLENAEYSFHYPPEVVADALKGWDLLGDDQRERYRSNYEAYARAIDAAKLDEARGVMTANAFGKSFGSSAIVFGVLAMAIAFMAARRGESR